MAFLIGDWWTSSESTPQVSDMRTVGRCGKTVRVIRWRTMNQKTMSLRTIASDSRVHNPGPQDCYNVPGESDPTAIDDWFLGKAEYVFDPDSGECRVDSDCARMGGDWDDVATMEAYDGL